MCVRGYYVVFKGKELVLRTTIIQGHISADTHYQLTQTLQQLILQLRTRYSIPKLILSANTNRKPPNLAIKYESTQLRP